MKVNPHFVCPPHRMWPELENGEVVDLQPRVLRSRSINGFDCWVSRTYYELKLAGRPVTIGPHVESGKVNIVGVRDFGRKNIRTDAFFAIPRLDAHEPKLADFVIHQNGLKGRGPTWDWVPHWGQPDIIRRDPSRGTRIEKLVFKGAEINLDADFKSDSFKSALADMGVTLETDAIALGDRDNNWGDYSQADVLLAVRNLTQYDAMQKPASKLTNAWKAEVPALLGPEPAYQEQKLSELDYIEVRTPTELLNAIQHLRRHPDIFTAMVQNGRDRSDEFTDERLRNCWIEILDGSLADAFNRWKETGWISRNFKVANKIFAERKSKIDYMRKIQEGDRILS